MNQNAVVFALATIVLVLPGGIIARRDKSMTEQPPQDPVRMHMEPFSAFRRRAIVTIQIYYFYPEAFI